MKLKSFNYFIGLLFIFFYSPLLGEEKIDIWKNKKETNSESQINEINKEKTQSISRQQSSEPLKALEKIQIQEASNIQADEQKVYGIYEPASYDFDLNMWSTTNAED